MKSTTTGPRRLRLSSVRASRLAVDTMLFLNVLLLFFFNAAASGAAVSSQNKLVNDMLESYDKKVKPTRRAEDPVVVTFSMDLYQIIEINEPQQYVLINAWIIERWRDELLYWDPIDFDDIKEIKLPYDVIWMPDTTLYNTLVMKDDEARRLLNAKLVANTTDRSAYIELLYPTIYKFSCQLNLHYFPFDSQICKMTFGSWTYDNSGIDYKPKSEDVGTSSYLENEGWSVKAFKAFRQEIKYPCCPNNYTNLQYSLHIKRKPLFYLVNLIIPTCIITLISIVGFFMPSSASGERHEKISLGITTLLSMSILMLMVSDQMPTTSTFIPLIGWFYLSMIILISMGTITSSVVIGVQKMGRLGERLSPRVVRLTWFLSNLSFTRVPSHLRHAADHCPESDPAADAYQKLMRGGSRKDCHKGMTLHNQPSDQLPIEGDAQLLHPYNNNDAPNGHDSSPIGTFKAVVLKQQKVIASEKETRIFAMREYDWLATVMERCSFMLFFILFMLLSFGINAIGLVQWLGA